MTPIIAFDLDGVVFDYCGAIATQCGNGLIAPSTYNFLERGWYSTKDEWWRDHFKVMEECAKMPLLDSTIYHSLNLLHSHGYRVIALTGRDKKYTKGTLHSIVNNKLDFDDVVVTGAADNKHLFSDVEWLLEDNPDALKMPIKNVIIRDQPYNRGLGTAVPRVHNALEFAEMVVNHV